MGDTNYLLTGMILQAMGSGGKQGFHHGFPFGWIRHMSLVVFQIFRGSFNINLMDPMMEKTPFV